MSQWQLSLTLRDDATVELTESLTIQILVLRAISPLTVQPASTTVFITDRDGEIWNIYCAMFMMQYLSALSVRILPSFSSVAESVGWVELQVVATAGSTTVPLSVLLVTHQDTAHGR